MNRGKDKPPTRRQVFDAALHVVFHTLYVHLSAAKYTLCIDPAPPKGDVFTKFTFELSRIHPYSIHLDWIENINPNINKVWDDLADRTTRVKKHLRPGMGVNEIK